MEVVCEENLVQIRKISGQRNHSLKTPTNFFLLSSLNKDYIDRRRIGSLIPL